MPFVTEASQRAFRDAVGAIEAESAVVSEVAAGSAAGQPDLSSTTVAPGGSVSTRSIT